MKKNILLAVVAVLLVGGIIGASSLYRHLSADYGNSSQLQDWTGGLGPQIPSGGGLAGGDQPDEGGEPVTPPAEGGGEGGEPVTPPAEGGGEGGEPVVPPAEGGDEGSEPVVPPAEGGDEGSEPVVPPAEGGDEGNEPVVPPAEGGDEGNEPVLPPEEDPQPPAVFSAPDFTVLDENGANVQLSDFLGKPIVVNFWATWCYYCKAEMADFNRAYEEFSDVQFVMVNATDGVRETVASAKKYVADNGFDFDLFFDVNGEAVQAYGVTGFPSTFFISASGDPVAYATGMLDYQTLVRGIEMIT